MQLDSAAADDLDAAFLVLHTQRSYTTVHLSRRGGCGYSFTTPKLIMWKVSADPSNKPNIHISYHKHNKSYSLCCLTIHELQQHRAVIW